MQQQEVLPRSPEQPLLLLQTLEPALQRQRRLQPAHVEHLSVELATVRAKN